jgi:hypothetical protein
MQKKIGEKFIQNPPGNKEKQCLTFSYWRFFCDLLYTEKEDQHQMTRLAAKLQLFTSSMSPAGQDSLIAFSPGQSRSWGKMQRQPGAPPIPSWCGNEDKSSWDVWLHPWRGLGG